jgi:hypothetical protein
MRIFWITSDSSRSSPVLASPVSILPKARFHRPFNHSHADGSERRGTNNSLLDIDGIGFGVFLGNGIARDLFADKRALLKQRKRETSAKAVIQLRTLDLGKRGEE